ncbi:MAG: hypothetical protein IJ302_08420 [Clostridia bacterium]|nr:hypothetical protein [Clostridia bacterium]
MKHHIRLSALLVSALLCASCFVACDADDTDTVPETKIAEPVAVDHVWSTDYITLPSELNVWQLENTVYDGNTLSFAATHVLNEEIWETEDVTVTYDFTTGDISYVSAPSVDEEVYGWAQYTVAAADGGTVCVFQNYNENTDSTLWDMVKFAADGSEVWKIDLGAQFTEIQDTQWMYISNLFTTADGTLFAFADQNILALSAEGERLFEINVGNYIDETFTTADGTLYVSFYEWNEMTGDGGYVYRAIDVEKKALGDALPIPETINLDNSRIHMADGYDMYFTNDTGLYALNFTDTEETMLCNWVNSDIIGGDISYRFTVLSSELAVFMDEDPVSGAAQLCVMKPVAPEDVTPKYLIEVAYSERGDNMMQRYAVAFNRESDKYRVVLNDYSGYHSGETAPVDILLQEIVAGDVPDIILCDDYSLPAETLRDKSLFLDLYTYMDKEGEIMNRAAFVPCVLAPFEAVDGTLPLLVQNFTLQSIAAKASVIGNRTSWTLEEALAFANSLGEDQYLFSMYYDNSPEAEPGARQNQLLQSFLHYTLDAFIDEETAACTFNDGRFASLLQFCNEAPVLHYQDVDSEAALFREDTLTLMKMDYISDISEYLQKKYYTFAGEEMVMIGYPTADASVQNGTVIAPSTMIGITADSPVADGAWEFIKRTYGDIESERYYRHNGFPAAYAALEAMFDTESRSYYIFEENGWSSTTYDEDEEIDLAWMEEEAEMRGGIPGHMEEEDRQALLSMIENASLVADTDTAIIRMIMEDASAYFAGAKTLEDTVSVIQSRVSIYVSEHQ